jgi:hypothetical protein
VVYQTQDLLRLRRALVGLAMAHKYLSHLAMQLVRNLREETWQYAAVAELKVVAMC